jgi:hypothetical protein
MRDLYRKADEAGKAAVKNLKVNPMYVQCDSVTYKIDDGLCGFAWIIVKPANCAFAKWLRKEGLAEKRYNEPGVSIWVGDYNQSHAKKREYAKVFAETLQQEGINASFGSRLD